MTEAWAAGPDVRVSIRDPEDVALARKHVRGVALPHGLGPARTEELAIAVSELAWNLILHAGGGEIEVTALHEGERRGLLVIARDQGPGIADPDRALEDGYSTRGSLGLGLPSARRLVDQFDLRSVPGQGTVVSVRKWAR